MSKHSGKAKSIPAGMTIAVLASMLITFGLSAVIAMSLDTERITWHQAGYWIMGMLFAASFAGGKTAFMEIKRQRIAVVSMFGVIYWGVLLCITALFFGGKFGAVWETAGIIGAGCLTSALISAPNKKNFRGRVGRGSR